MDLRKARLSMVPWLGHRVCFSEARDCGMRVSGGD